MLKILSIVFLAILFIIVFFVSIIRSVFRALFGRRAQPNSARRNQQGTRDYQRDASSHSTNNSANQDTESPKKVIGKEEGEYVDFEELD